MRPLGCAGLLWAATCLPLACGKSEAVAVVLEIRSSLGIPNETDTLSVRVMDGPSPLSEERYALGIDPRDRWPQTLPLLPGERSPTTVDVLIELSRSSSGAPSSVVGFVATRVTFPSSGVSTLPIDVPRACEDRDGDRYGIGRGCLGADCDENAADVPAQRACPPADAGVAVDAGGVACGDVTCAPDRGCFGNQCGRRCTDDTECGDPDFTCVEPPGVCYCPTPCEQNPAACGLFSCVDGCCDYN
ncbi:MAG: hypothetical protein IT384_34945 [Deltaproteobacteria bacterium]|nr:hypothetical protein [Deltaproteobacteria bacterium]